MKKIKQNNNVLFFYDDSKKWLMKVSRKQQFHTHVGIIDHKKVIGKEYGSAIKTNKGKIIYLLEPTVYDYVMKSQRSTQIVYPKDLGYIAARTGLQSGHTIVEIGTGSGSLTTFLASIVKPRGHVYTYDVDENFMAIARKNIEKAGISKYVTMEKLDIKNTKKVPQTDADMVVVDLGDPWTVVPQARKMLKGSGYFVAICPTMNQLEKLASALRENDFFDLEFTEQIVRTIEAREGKTRHSFRGIGHTTYVAFARKVTTPKDLRRIIPSMEIKDVPDVESAEESVEDEGLSGVKK
ncbi:MAG: tRNA (adenine-N1)-methyltransferase [Thaumarchaeota archaeon]|nr:tRNA (adenine-N1)-methyltransferase [Nitrososphaerota archaeon]MDE1872097.1 tRNA (adenine-N1)-methyltransferase [Nitrososphaerota archaeon]